jgi:hypothetical protein
MQGSAALHAARVPERPAKGAASQRAAAQSLSYSQMAPLEAEETSLAYLASTPEV